MKEKQMNTNTDTDTNINTILIKTNNNVSQKELYDVIYKNFKAGKEINMLTPCKECAILNKTFVKFSFNILKLITCAACSVCHKSIKNRNGDPKNTYSQIITA